MSVTKLNDTEFQQTLGKDPKVLVKFFADWCGNCKLVSPKFDRLSQDVEGVSFVEINAEESPEARKLAGVTNLPFFASFRNGQLVEGVATSRIEYVTEMARGL
jgi:thiol-disulfide isomerase/thioredoxin